MRLIQIVFVLFLSFNLCAQNSYAQKNIKRNPVQRKTKKKSFANRDYKEIKVSYSLMNDKFGLDLNGAKGSVRALFQGINLYYVFQKPGKNIRYLFNYGFGISYGTVKGIATPFGNEAKGQTWYMTSFVPGIDFRNDFRTRIGLFAPISFRAIDFGFEEDLKVKDDDPFSFGIGARYVNAFSLKNSFSFSVTHQVIWKATIWDLSWQYRLGL
jgi:hypothetical protein